MVFSTIQTSAIDGDGIVRVALGQGEESRVEVFLRDVMALVGGFSFRVGLRLLAELVECRHGDRRSSFTSSRYCSAGDGVLGLLSVGSKAT